MSEHAAERLLRIARRVEQGYSRQEVSELRDIASTIQGADNAHDELVQALEELLAEFDNDAGQQGQYVEDTFGVELARTALAKAKGTTP